MNKKDIIVLPFSLEHIDGVMEIDNLSFSVPWSRNSYETELKNKFAKYIVVLDKSTNSFRICRNVAYNRRVPYNKYSSTS